MNTGPLNVAGGDVAGDDILNTAEDQIFADNSSVLATLANMTALAVSCSCLRGMTCSYVTSPPFPHPTPTPLPSPEMGALGDVTWGCSQTSVLTCISKPKYMQGAEI